MINPQQIFAPPNYVNHWNESMTDEMYHSDRRAVNSSSLKRMIKSPRAFYYTFFLGKDEEPTEAMKFGTLAHMALLQGSKFQEQYVVMPEIIGYTKAGLPTTSANALDVQEKKRAWLADQPPGAIITTAEDRDRLFAMIDSVLSHEQASKLLSKGKPEIAGYWRDPETGILLRIKPDFLPFDVSVALDVKTTQDCVWDEFRRSVESLRYDFQTMMYDEGIFQITGIRPEHRVWLTIESKAPYEVACYEVPPQYEATGRYEFRAQLRRLKECAMRNEWPQRQVEIEYGEMSPWFFKKYELKGAFHDILI